MKNSIVTQRRTQNLNTSLKFIEKKINKKIITIWLFILVLANYLLRPALCIAIPWVSSIASKAISERVGWE